MSKDIKALVETVRASVKSQEAALSELKPEALPEPIRKSIEEIRASLNAQLKALEPLDQVPAAHEAAFAINCLVEAMTRMQEYAGQVFSRLQEMSKNLGSLTQSYNDLKARVDGGELVEKAKVDERCELARQQGVESARAEILELRRRVIAGLPEAPESVLSLPAAEFAARVQEAQQNIKAASEKGLAPDGRGSRFLKRALWLKKEEFERELASLQEDGLLGEFEPMLSGEHKEDSARPRIVGLV